MIDAILIIIGLVIVIYLWGVTIADKSELHYLRRR